MVGEPPHSAIELFLDAQDSNVYFDFSGYVFDREEILRYEHKHLGYDIPVDVCSGSQQDTKDSSKKTYRSRGEITQKQAADLCGVSLRTFQNWEKGSVRPPISGMPTRDSAVAFRKWSLTLSEHNKSMGVMKGIERARTMSPSDLDKAQRSSAFADDPDGEADQWQGTGGGRRVTSREADDD